MRSRPKFQPGGGARHPRAHGVKALRTRQYAASPRRRAALLCALAALACSRSQDAADREGLTGFRGMALSSPVAKPSFTLTDVNGHRFDFAKETEGKVALLFFGYTSCPDICPLHMANIAAVLKRLPPSVANMVRTVFVTTDPQRDTPERLKQWLGVFDSTFIGLTGTQAELDSVQRSLGIRPAEREYPSADSSAYSVAHSAVVYAFARDGLSYLIYPSGIRQEDWAHDLPKLADDETGEAIRRELASTSPAGVAAAPPAAVEMRGLEIPLAIIAEPVSMSEAALYLTIDNGTPQSDTLIGVVTDVAATSMLHDSFSSGRMASISGVPVPPGGSVRLEPGARHFMLMSLRRKLVPGDSVLVRVLLKKAGTIEAMAHVLPYIAVQAAMSARKE